jgi:hypothetical protein
MNQLASIGTLCSLNGVSLDCEYILVCVYNNIYVCVYVCMYVCIKRCSICSTLSESDVCMYKHMCIYIHTKDPYLHSTVAHKKYLLEKKYIQKYILTKNTYLQKKIKKYILTKNTYLQNTYILTFYSSKLE